MLFFSDPFSLFIFLIYSIYIFCLVLTLLKLLQAIRLSWCRLGITDLRRHSLLRWLWKGVMPKKRLAHVIKAVIKDRREWKDQSPHSDWLYAGIDEEKSETPKRGTWST